MLWWNSKTKVPESSVSDHEIEELKKKAEAVSTKVEKMEKSVMDGESMWMLIKCPVNHDSVCREKESHESKKDLEQCQQT